MVRGARSTTNLASINLGTLKQLPVPAPPLDEQRAVVAAHSRCLDARRRLAAEIERSAERSAGLRCSILAAAFNGTLVPQDPADEPASALLERIRTERLRRRTPRRSRNRSAESPAAAGTNEAG